MTIKPVPQLTEKDKCRFWAKVRKASPNKCWEWIAALSTNGYGRLMHRSGQVVNAHRISWVLAHGEIPDGLCVLHTCDNRKCVNPAHLFLGTMKDNAIDMVRKNRNYEPPPDAPYWGFNTKKKYGDDNWAHKNAHLMLRGEKHPISKLRECDVLEIRRLKNEEGVTRGEIAKRFSISTVLVSYIVLRRLWKHVA